MNSDTLKTSVMGIVAAEERLLGGGTFIYSCP